LFRGSYPGGDRRRRRSKETSNQHFWQGRPNHWHTLLPKVDTTDIARARAGVIHRLGYGVDPDPNLSHRDAVDHWRTIAMGRAARRPDESYAASAAAASPA
jgi:hypothetical protein